jgi:hypothetical protein
VSNVPPENRFSPADRAATTRRLCEALAMESGNEIPAHHRTAYTRSAAGAIGCTLEDLRACEQAELIGLCDEFAATGRGELRVCILSDEPDKAGTIVVIQGVTDLASVAHALEDADALAAGLVAAALYRHPAGGRFAPDLR